MVKTGKPTWKALVEAKIRKNRIEDEQIASYLEAARDSKIDVVITVSNQFVARADHSPIKVSKRLLKKASPFHWSWTYVVTQCEILSRDVVADPRQAFMLSEFLRLLNHRDTGVERFTSMRQGVCAAEIRGCHKTAGAVLHARAQRDAPEGPRTGCVRFNPLSSAALAPHFR